jgi:hypothetical protein
MNYNNYKAVGVDKKILLIQNVLSDKLGFSNVDFYGRVQRTIQADGKTFIPEVHISNTERKCVYYNDQEAQGGNVFFIDDTIHKALTGNQFEVKVKVVFMLNLNKLITDATYRQDAEIQEECLKFIKSLRVMEVTELEKGLSNVLKGFNIESIKTNDIQPYHTFSINGIIKYNFSC